MWNKRRWKELLEILQSRELTADEICSTIVKLGKPFDRGRILAAKDVVATYLDHPSHLVRYEAMWFLTSWGGLHEYQPALIHALRYDPDQDNRSFAATCLCRLQEGTRNPEAVSAIVERINDDNEDELTRLYAYRALLVIAKGQSEFEFSPHDHKLTDIDWDWVHLLSKLVART